MTRIALTSLLVLALAGAAFAQNPPPRLVNTIKSPQANPAQLAPNYEAMYQKERDKNRELKAEVQSLQARIAEMTRPGGSLVHAYCASPTVSRNTAGASSDCESQGYTCEPVSGLCRTSARSSADCAGSNIHCPTTNTCVRPDPKACPSG
jgi:hypothetical protein